MIVPGKEMFSFGSCLLLTSRLNCITPRQNILSFVGRAFLEFWRAIGMMRVSRRKIHYHTKTRENLNDNKAPAREHCKKKLSEWKAVEIIFMERNKSLQQSTFISLPRALIWKRGCIVPVELCPPSNPVQKSFHHLVATNFAVWVEEVVSRVCFRFISLAQICPLTNSRPDSTGLHVLLMNWWLSIFRWWW